MKKFICLILCSILLQGIVSAEILTTAVKTKLAVYKDEILTVYPNIETECAGEIIVGYCVSGEENIGFTPKYTDSQWVDEVVKRFLLQVIRRGEKVIHLNNIVEQEITVD